MGVVQNCADFNPVNFNTGSRCRARSSCALLSPLMGQTLSHSFPLFQFWWLNHVWWPPHPKPQDPGCNIGARWRWHKWDKHDECLFKNIQCFITVEICLLGLCWLYSGLKQHNWERHWCWNTAVLLPLQHIFFIISHKKYFGGQHKWNYLLWGFLEMLKYWIWIWKHFVPAFQQSATIKRTWCKTWKRLA